MITPVGHRFQYHNALDTILKVRTGIKRVPFFCRLGLHRWRVGPAFEESTDKLDGTTRKRLFVILICEGCFRDKEQTLAEADFLKDS